MTTANSFDLELLSPAVAAARKALLRVDEEDIPPRVRVVARRSGRLPAPLAKSLIAQLDDDPWLRQLALDELANSLNPDQASAAEEFLKREPGWEDRLARLTDTAQAEREQESRRKLEGELAAARAEIASLRRQVRSLERKARPAVSRAPSDTWEHRHQELDRDLRETQKALAAAETARRELAIKVEGLEERITALRQRRPEKSAPRPPLAGGIRRAPLDLARDLDARFQALVVPPVGVRSAVEGAVTTDHNPPPAIPAGIRPDGAAAVEWIRSYPGSLTVAVDGWNLAFQFKNPPGRRERNRVEAAVGRLSQRTAGKRRLLVLFDSSFDLPGTRAGTHPQVEVRFPASADEALIDLAREESPLVVISSDRRVREETGRYGAIALWGEALIEWLR